MHMSGGEGYGRVDLRRQRGGPALRARGESLPRPLEQRRPGPDGPGLRLELRRPRHADRGRGAHALAEPSAPPPPWSAGCRPRERHAHPAVRSATSPRPTAAASRRSPVRSGSSARTRSRSPSRSSMAPVGRLPRLHRARRRASTAAWPAGSAGAPRPAPSAPTISTGWRWIPRCRAPGSAPRSCSSMERRLAGARPAHRRGDRRPGGLRRHPRVLRGPRLPGGVAHPRFLRAGGRSGRVREGLSVRRRQRVT